MKQLVLLLGLCTILTVQTNAQKRSATNYQTGIGLRVNPWMAGFTIKHFVKGPHAIEGIVASNFAHDENVTFTFLYEYHWQLGQPDFRLFAGGGAHIGIYDRWYYDRERYYEHGDGAYVSPGLDGIIGLEYRFKKIPLAISGDLKPYFNFTGGHKFYGEQIGGATARWTFR
ncbi:hypothetical protein [Chitinophaga tropicalis]|uniref:DUF3575 domain-containing protein n=1 Tax=Chitinophaga tropicalis TaxID=2683588 RepID=A0A7K1U7S5_9BACT|nr:hypothetical protein [Chitinophaga tropicalis]MVT10399.1 hypothetical protein [Chitinophaga tropicalis]